MQIGTAIEIEWVKRSFDLYFFLICALRDCKSSNFHDARDPNGFLLYVYSLWAITFETISKDLRGSRDLIQGEITKVDGRIDSQ